MRSVRWVYKVTLCFKKLRINFLTFFFSEPAAQIQLPCWCCVPYCVIILFWLVLTNVNHYKQSNNSAMTTSVVTILLFIFSINFDSIVFKNRNFNVDFSWLTSHSTTISKLFSSFVNKNRDCENGGNSNKSVITIAHDNMFFSRSNTRYESQL